MYNYCSSPSNSWRLIFFSQIFQINFFYKTSLVVKFIMLRLIIVLWKWVVLNSLCIFSRVSQVSYPFDRFVAVLFSHSKRQNFEPRSSAHRNLESENSILTLNSNFRGGFCQSWKPSSIVVTSALSIHSFSPKNFFTLHIIACLSASYFAFPFATFVVTSTVFSGTGIFRTTFCAKNIESKMDLSLIL